MKIKLVYIFFFLLSIVNATEAQLQLKTYENNYIQFTYPQSWTIKENSLFIKIDIPDPTIISSNIQISIRRTDIISPSIIEGMMSSMEVLHYGTSSDAMVTNI